MEVGGDLAEAIAMIANHEKVIKHCEPNLAWHEDLKEHQVRRILYAYGLFLEEFMKRGENDKS
jgi:hypothetical protein